jgi:hypothetical protein
MAQFTIEIPDQLLPALAVEFGLVQGSTDAPTGSRSRGNGVTYLKTLVTTAEGVV